MDFGVSGSAKVTEHVQSNGTIAQQHILQGFLTHLRPIEFRPIECSYGYSQSIRKHPTLILESIK